VGIKVKVEGGDKVAKNLRKQHLGYNGAVAAALYQLGLMVDSKATKRVPVDTNTLRRSHYVAPPTGMPRPVVEIGFGTDYAVPVHERVEVFHKVGGPLYLKSSFDEVLSGFKRKFAKLVKKNLRAKVGMGIIGGGAPTKPNA